MTEAIAERLRKDAEFFYYNMANKRIQLCAENEREAADTIDELVEALEKSQKIIRFHSMDQYSANSAALAKAKGEA